LVGEAAYNCAWHLQSISFQRDLKLVILRSQRSLKLTAGPFGHLSMELFGKVRVSLSELMIIK
jgi:7tm Odorant receptor.